MIQRKQTLFLLFSGLLMLIPMFFPILSINLLGRPFGTIESSGLLVNGTLTTPTWWFLVLNILIVLISFVTIFLYRIRLFQMRLTVYNMLIKLGTIIFACFYIWYQSKSVPLPLSYSVHIWTAAPIVSLILDYLAYRAIAIDERTVQYMYRLR